LDSDPSVNSLGPKFGPQPIGALDYGVFFGFGFSVNSPLSTPKPKPKTQNTRHKKT